MNKSSYKSNLPTISWLIILTAITCIVFITWRYEEIIKENAKEFNEVAKAESAKISEGISHTFGMLYQSLRTIARLPSTRTIDRYGRNFDLDAQATFQELYNNLYSNISVSELYIVPVGFDPDKIDPNTGLPSEPILTIDEYIVGQHAGKSSLSHSPKPIEEIEIYEYELMRDQLHWLEKNYPTETSFSELQYPAISGPEVITCDNTYFNPYHPNNNDRFGLVYSVPFYGIDGKLRGMVSGVVLTKVLQNLIPKSNHAMVNTEHGYVITPKLNGIWQQSMESIRKGIPDTNLLASNIINLHINDKSGNWKLWSGFPKDRFIESDKIQTYKRNELISIIVVILFAFSFIIIARQQHKARLFIMNQNEYLEKKILDRTQALTQSNEELVVANEAKAKFLSRVSHELRTPLNAIIGYSDFLLEEGISTKESALEDISKIRNSGSHLLSLINEVLDISKIEAGKMEIYIDSFSISELIDEVLSTTKPLIDKNSNELSVDVSNDIGLISTDKLKVKQILLNLLSNASKFTRQGKIGIRVYTKISEGDRLVVFEVSDTGIGIDKDKLNFVFDEFYQAHESNKNIDVGTGLGLAISMRLANLLQGSIEVTNNSDKGSTFTLILPKQPSYCLIPSEIIVHGNVVQKRH